MEKERTLESAGLFPTFVLRNPTTKQAELFKSAVSFCYKFLAHKNSTIDERENQFNADNFAEIEQGKDKYLVYYSDNYKMYYLMARSNPFVMKTLWRFVNTKIGDKIELGNSEKILSDYELGWFDVNGEIFPMGIVPFCSIEHPTSKQLNNINIDVVDFLEQDGMFELLAQDTPDGVVYYLRYCDLGLSLNTDRVLNTRTIALESVREALGDKGQRKLTYFDEINNPNTPPESFVSFSFQKIEDKLTRKYSTQAESTLPQYKSILSKHTIASQFRPIFITKFENDINSNVYSFALTKMMNRRISIGKDANFEYAVIKNNGANYAVLYTDNNETANYLIQRASIFNGVLKNQDSRFYTSYTYVINNKGDCLPADYFPICILNKKDKDYTEGLNILEKGVGAGYRLALVSNGDDTRCYLAHNEGTGARYTSYKHLRDDKISMLANLKKNKIEATPLNDNGLTTASYTRDTAISFEPDFQELKL